MWASTGSLVVPGVESTRDRSSPVRALRIEDFPTFGRPTIATAPHESSLLRCHLGKGGHEGLEEVPRSSPMERRKGLRLAQTQPKESRGERLVGGIVHFVRRHHNRLFRFSKEVGDYQIVLVRSHGCVHH